MDLAASHGARLPRKADILLVHACGVESRVAPRELAAVGRGHRMKVLMLAGGSATTDRGFHVLEHTGTGAPLSMWMYDPDTDRTELYPREFPADRWQEDVYYPAPELWNSTPVQETTGLETTGLEQDLAAAPADQAESVVPVTQSAPATSGDANPPLYPDLYTDPEFAEFAQKYEDALGELLAKTRTAARGAWHLVSLLFPYLSEHLGSKENAASAFGIRAEGGKPPHEVLEELLRTSLADDTVQRLVRAFEDAAYANTDSPYTLARLWQDRPELNEHAIPARPPLERSWTREERAELNGRRGLPLTHGPDVHTERQLRIARALGATERELRLSRDAMLARNLKDRAAADSQDENGGRKLNSAYETMRVAQDEGLSDDIDKDLSVVDVAGFHSWLDAVYGPGQQEAFATLPLHTRYALDPTHRLVYAWNAWRDKPEDLLADHAYAREHRESYVRWLALHGAQDILRENLQDAHYLSLRTRRDNSPLLDPRFTRDDPQSLELLGQRLDGLVRAAHAAPELRPYPPLLRNDEEFAGLADSGASLEELLRRAAELAPVLGRRDPLAPVDAGRDPGDAAAQPDGVRRPRHPGAVARCGDRDRGKPAHHRGKGTGNAAQGLGVRVHAPDRADAPAAGRGGEHHRAGHLAVRGEPRGRDGAQWRAARPDRARRPLRGAPAGRPWV